MDQVKPKIAVLVNNGVDYDARVLKTAETLNFFGYQVAVFCTGLDEQPTREAKGGIQLWRFHKKYPNLQNNPPVSPLPLHRRVFRSVFLRSKRLVLRLLKKFGCDFQPIQKKAKKNTNKIQDIVRAVEQRYRSGLQEFSPDLIYANDLDCLEVASLYSQSADIPFVVDMHELQSERPFRNEPELRDTVLKIESENLKHASAVITVSDSISAWYASQYAIQSPAVIYNSPEHGFESSNCVSDVRSCLGLCDDALICVYTGILTRGRGLEQVLDSMIEHSNLHYALVGPRNNVEAYEAIKTLAKEKSLVDRVHFVDPVPFQHVSAFISTADFGIIPAVARTLNQEFGLPNKLFEMIFAGLPVVCVNIEQRRKLLDQYGVGFYMADNSPEEMSKAFNSVIEHISLDGNKEKVRCMGKTALSKVGWYAQRDKIKEICEKALH